MLKTAKQADVAQEPNALTFVGRFGAAHGVKGWIKVNSFTEIFDTILDYAPWYVKIKGKWQTVPIRDARITDKQVLVSIEGYDDRDIVRAFTNLDIAVLREQLPELSEGEFYQSDLEGLTVIDQQGTVLGTVHMLLETGANDVFIVRNEQTEIAIPYTDNVVKTIDLEQRQIYVDWDVEFLSE